MNLNTALIRLQNKGFKLKMITSTRDPNCAFSFIAHKSGMGIGPNGLYGYGSTPVKAMQDLAINIEEFLKEKAKEEEDALDREIGHIERFNSEYMKW